MDEIKRLELEANLLKLFYDSMVQKENGKFGFDDKKFTDGLREIMPPTCTATERMFLDEIRQLYEWNDHLGFPHLQRKEITKYSNIYQQDFKKTNLRELVNE